MSRKTAAFMSPQAAIAKGQENSKGWKKNPMKLIYNFDAHKKTASEGMFSNPSSEIPDEMWRAATPMQRQADAVVLWAELTGKHASNCGNHGPAKPKKKATKTKTKLASYARSAAVGAVLGGATGGGTAAKYSKKDRKKKTLRGAAAGAAIGAAAGLTGAGIRSALAGRVADQIKPGPRPGTYAVPAGLLDKFVAQNRAVKGLQGAGAIGGGVLAGRAASKKSSEKKASAKAQEAILAAAKNPALTGAALGAPVGALKEYLDNRSRPGSVSSREAKAVGALAAGKARKLSDKEIRALKKSLARAREEKKSVGKQVLKGAVVGAGAGAAFGAAHKAIRKKR